MKRQEIEREKAKLMDVKAFLKFESDLESEHVEELLESVNIIIGRLNCELTDDDKELERLTIKDGIR